MMRRKTRLKEDRTNEQLWEHYQVEKELAAKLKLASREQRKEMYRTMYDELFRRVPHHPRLHRSSERTAAEIRSGLALVQPYLSDRATLLEFAPGDCEFSISAARYVQQVYALDISDQRVSGRPLPSNVKLMVFDGFRVDGIRGGSVDVAFSDQLIEHIHPDDVLDHLRLAYGILKTGGCYVFRTPHGLTGPHDISRFFSATPEGFHLREWTDREILPVLLEAGFSRVKFLWSRRTLAVRVPYVYFSLFERVFACSRGLVPRVLRKLCIPSVCCAAQK